MKILSINKFFWKKGGSEAVFFAEKQLLEQAGHSVIPFCMKHPENLESEYAKFFVDEVDYSAPGLINKLSASSKIIYSFEAAKKMTALLDEENPDLAHFHIFQHQISPSVFGPLTKKNIPKILTLHDLKPLCPNYRMYVNDNTCEACKGQKFYNCFLNRCTKNSRLKSLVNVAEMYLHYALGYYQSVDRYIAVSRFYRNKMIEFGFPPDKVEYLPNFIDIDAYHNPKRDEGFALYFGRLSMEKGVDVLLDAAQSCPEIPLVIAGTGPEEEALRRRIESQDLNNVRLIGYVSGEELKSLVSRSAFSIVPSRWFENCPMSVLESFALGTPVVGANIGGIPELIDDGVDGVIFEAGNACDLSDKMRDMWSRGADRKIMGANGREKIERQFGPKQHSRELLSIYTDVLESSRDVHGRRS